MGSVTEECAMVDWNNTARWKDGDDVGVWQVDGRVVEEGEVAETAPNFLCRVAMEPRASRNGWDTDPILVCASRLAGARCDGA